MRQSSLAGDPGIGLAQKPHNLCFRESFLHRPTFAEPDSKPKRCSEVGGRHPHAINAGSPYSFGTARAYAQLSCESNEENEPRQG